MKKILASIFLLSLAACSSAPKKAEVIERPLEEIKHTEIKKEYEVRDASSNYRPGWIEDAEVWAKQNEKDIEKNRFFSYETEPKVTRGVACDIAKANTRLDIASEITTFIEKTLGTTQEGNASIDMNSPKLSPLKEYMENTLAEKVQSLIHGAAVVKTYWEQREYKKSLGAKEDFKAFTCAVLIRMEGARLKKSVEEAANFVAKKVEDPEAKETVKKALQNVSDNFLKARQGTL
ncbi:MAG: hypothetical protein Q7U04_03485 [Bacteriovorax sp.]|nr:hypothetical protein [Bacteriovorax sp.]